MRHPTNPDWKKLVRQRLPGTSLSAEAEADLVDELAQLLEDASGAAKVDLSSEASVADWLEEQVPRWTELAEIAHKTARRPAPPGNGSPFASPRTPSPQAAAWGPARITERFVSCLRNVRWTVQRLSRKPIFAAVALLSLAVGIAANTAIYSFVNAFQTHTAAFDSPGELVDIYRSDPNEPMDPAVLLSYPDFADLRDHTQNVFSDVLLSRVSLTRGETASGSQSLMGEAVSGNYFELLGIDMALGRPLLPSDDLHWGGHPVVVLGHSFWQDAFGADPSIVGREIRLGNRPYTVVGIAPASYKGALYGLFPSHFFVPSMMYGALHGSRYDLENRRNNSAFVKARLLPGATLSDAQAVADGLATHLHDAGAPGWDGEQGFQLARTADVLVFPGWDPAIRATGWLLSLAVGALLLLACTNLTSFLLADALDSKKEIALRLALGARRRQLMAGLSMECLALALCGGITSIPITLVLIRFLEQVEIPGPIPIHVEVALDLRIFLFAALVSFAAGLALGFMSAWKSTDWRLLEVLRNGTAGGGLGGKSRLRGLLVAAQVAGSTALLIAAALFYKNLVHSQAVDPGFGDEPTAMLNVRMPEEGKGTAQNRRWAKDLVEAIDGLPGVLAVGAISNMPLNGVVRQDASFSIDGVEPPPGRELQNADCAVVDTGFFEAAGIEIIAGRAFTGGDEESGVKVAVISEAMAERFWPGKSPLGQLIRYPHADVEVVGVASDIKVRSLAEAPRPFVYVPLQAGRLLDSTFQLSLVARSNIDPEVLLPRMERAALDFDPDLWVLDAKTMDEHLALLQLPARLSASVLSLMALLAVSLAAIGLYGAVSYAVSQRAHEIGVRLSLGANGSSIVALLMTTGLRPVLFGSLIGLAIALAIGKLASGLLSGTSVTDPWVLGPGMIILLAIAALAAWLPARRASRVDPMLALRRE